MVVVDEDRHAALTAHAFHLVARRVELFNPHGVVLDVGLRERVVDPFDSEENLDALRETSMSLNHNDLQRCKPRNSLSMPQIPCEGAPA